MLLPGVLLALTCPAAVPRREWRRLGHAAGLVALLVVLVLVDRWFLGFKSKDLVCLHREFAIEAAPWRGGQPFVSTATGLGRPMLAFPVSTYYHPFAFAYLLPDPDFALHLYATLHVTWGAVWWWLLLARHPQTRGGSRSRWWIVAAVALATSNGFVITRFFGYAGPEYAFGAAWVPSLLYATLELVRGRRRQLPQMALFALSASSLFTGAPNVALAVAPVALLFGASVALARPAGRRRAAAMRLVSPAFLGAGGLALVMAASEMLPAFEALRASNLPEMRGNDAHYRFVPYTIDHFLRTFTTLGYSAYGREPLFHWSLYPILAFLAWRSRPFRWTALGAAALLGLGAADWAAGGLGSRTLEAVVPMVANVSMTPTVQALFAWAMVGAFCAAVHPRALGGRSGSVAAVAIVASLLACTLPYRVHRGYDMAREAELFAWSARLEVEGGGRPFVATIRPDTQFAYLVPDAIAREQGLRTVREMKGHLMPTGYFDALQPDRLGDWGRLHRMGVTHVISIDGVNPRSDLFAPLRVVPARELAARPEAEDSYLADTVRVLVREQPQWDGAIHVFARTRAPDEPPPPEDTTNGVPAPSFPSIWPWIALVFIPLLLRRSGSGRPNG